MANLTDIPFGPLVRSVTAVEQHLIPPGAVTGGTNMLVDPIAGGMFKRSGCAIAGGDVVSGGTNHATNGILEGGDLKWSARPLRLRQFYSDALADGAQGGYPTYSCLYGRNDLGASWPLIDNGELMGTEYVRRPNANYQLMQEFGSSAYPTGGGAMGAEIKYKVVPFWYESGEGGYNRGAHVYARRFAVSGSWGTIDAGRWRYYGALRGTPVRWDGGCNDSSSSISNAIRLTPTGPFAPLWVPTSAGNGDSGGNLTSYSATYPWLGGDSFYLSVLYQFEDGSYSIPTYPILQTVGTIGTPHGFTSVTYSNIPIGPEGTIARVLLRSPKVLRTATTSDLTVAIDDLRVLGVLRNNTQKSYIDTLGDDDGLLQDTDVVRWDLICPPRSRYLGTGDQRVLAGYVLPSPCAIQLTCVHDAATATAAYSYNQPDTYSGLAGAQSSLYRVTTSGIELQLASGGTAVAGTLVTIDFATYDTLKKVVDQINASDTVFGGTNTMRWRAQLAPGADPSAPSTGLCPTVLTVANCTATGVDLATSTSQGFEPVPVGYKCYAAAGMTAGTFARLKDCSVAASNLIQLSQASTTSAATVTFYADCGDEACVTTADSKGWIRTFGSGYPGMIYFKRSALEGYAQPKKDRIYFTISSPGAAATGISVAANAWGASNRRDGINNSGQIMGLVDVEGAAVVLYRDRVGLFINERGANTAEDFDYRIKTINAKHGCVSPWSVVEVAGCAVYATAVGIKATDKSRREILLSGDVYQPVRGLGDFAYELPLCVAGAAQDVIGSWMAGSSFGNRLVYSYRRSTTSIGWMVYDFSPGADQLGLEALGNPETREPYGWSTMCQMDANNDVFGPRAHGAVMGSTGLLFYGAINDNSGTTDGRIDQFFTGSSDNGVAITGTFATKRVLADPGMRLVAGAVTAQHRIAYSGPQLSVTRIEAGSVDATVLTTSSGSNDLLYERMQWSQAGRSPARMLQLAYYDGASSTGGLVFALSQSAEVLQKVGD